MVAIIILVLAAVMLTFLHLKSASIIHLVHAGREKALAKGTVARRRMPLLSFAISEQGEFIDDSKKFIGIADGTSGISFGIPSGKKFLGDKLDVSGRGRLASGDIVVVDSETGASHGGYTLRRIKDLVDEPNGRRTVDFFSDGQPHKHRPIDEIVAKVTHIAA